MKNKIYPLIASSLIFIVSCEKDPEIIYETITVTETETVTVQVQPPTPDTQTVGGGGIYFIDDSQTWTNDRIWIMNGKVVVRNGGTLIIQEGTIIKAEDGQGTDATALVIAKGGTLNANGTAENPVVFTDTADQLSYSNTDKISPLEHERFEATIRKWLKEHPVSEYNNKASEREIAFNAFIKTTYDQIREIALEDATDIEEHERFVTERSFNLGSYFTKTEDQDTMVYEDGTRIIQENAISFGEPVERIGPTLGDLAKIGFSQTLKFEERITQEDGDNILMENVAGRLLVEAPFEGVKISDISNLYPNRSKKFTDYIEFVSDRPGHDLRYAIDASKIKDSLEWVPNETFESGIRKTINWYVENEKWWSN